MPIILTTWEVEIRRTEVRGQPKTKKFTRFPVNQQKLGMVMHACHSSYAGSVNRRIKVQAGPGINLRPYLKNDYTRCQWFMLLRRQRSGFRYETNMSKKKNKTLSQK
jgi:hypothetical protein